MLWATVPHVTIAPLARGVGSKLAPRSRYFPYFTRPWIDDDDFDPRDDPHLTGPQARAIDNAIDAYNDTIQASVARARAAGDGHVDFERPIARDTLIEHPPQNLRPGLKTLAWGDDALGWFTRVFTSR